MGLLTKSWKASIWRIRAISAFLVAPLVPAVIISPLTKGDPLALMVPAAVVAYLHAAALGIPVAYILNRFRKVSFATTAIASFLIGATPVAVFGIFSTVHGREGEGWSVVVKDYEGLVDTICIFGGLGLSAGIAWWLLMAPWAKPKSPEGPLP